MQSLYTHTVSTNRLDVIIMYMQDKLEGYYKEIDLANKSWIDGTNLSVDISPTNLPYPSSVSAYMRMPDMRMPYMRMPYMRMPYMRMPYMRMQSFECLQQILCMVTYLHRLRACMLHKAHLR